MDELIEQTEHVGEIARTLKLFQTPLQELSEREVIARANQTAGLTSRYPRPQAALHFAKTLGLVRLIKGKYKVSPRGIQFLGGDAEYQARFIIGLLADIPEGRMKLREIFDLIQGTSQLRIARDSLDEKARTFMRLLQQLGCFRFSRGYFILNPSFEDVVSDLVTSRSALGEEALWKRLENQRLRALHIEECVVEHERKRLQALGKHSLADGVVRISALNTGAGYDVGSFEANGQPRSIEVKSSVGTQLEFDWSENERAVAEKLGNHYWIYFVPLSHLIESEISCLIRIKDPIKKLKQHVLRTKPSAWKVNTSENVTRKIETQINQGQTFDW